MMMIICGVAGGLAGGMIGTAYQWSELKTAVVGAVIAMSLMLACISVGL